MNQKKNKLYNPKFAIAVFFLLFTIPLASQSFIKPAKIDSTYIVDYGQKLSARLYFLRESISFSIDPQQFSPEIRYRPNTHTRIGVAGFYKWFGVGLAVDAPLFSSRRDAKRGRSSMLDLRVNAYGESMVGEINYQRYKSFYISNPSSVMDSWKDGMDFPVRPDMSIHSFSAILYYILNHKKHSLKAAYLQNMRQKKSSGSLVFGPAFAYLKVSADSGLVPSNYMIQKNLNDELNIKRGSFSTVGIYAGYSYTLIFLKYFYINASLLPGIYFMHENYHTPNEHYIGSKWSLLWIGRSAIGYNSNKWYCGIAGVTGFQSEPLPVGNADFNMDLFQIRLWFGTRFNIFVKNK
ncbi:DUF4421 family protein [Bacteroidota bacterium]